LSKALFPIGHLEKSEVRKIAQNIGLPNAQRKDSQGICFVGKVDIKEFLQKKIPNSIGDVVDTEGNVLGKHKGVFYYTIGQRKGLDIGGQSEPIFVVKKDIKNNILVVGTDADEELRNKELTCSELYFLGKAYDLPLNCHAKIRYRQEDQKCRVEQGEDGYKVVFDESQRAIASGQIVALYDGDVLFASGVID
jgi:tRNA-specific 2-thiouridylase